MRLIRYIDINPVPFIDRISVELDFSKGSHNVILFKHDINKNVLIEGIFDFCSSSLNVNPYVISGFNLKPYLNLVDNIYDMFGLDLELDEVKNIEFKKYCDIFKFEFIDQEFHFLSEHDKFKSMFIATLFSKSDVILFDGICYKIKINRYMEDIYKILDDFKLYSNKSFIEFKKASHDLY